MELKGIKIIMIFFLFFVIQLSAQTVYYNDEGLKTEKAKATSYRIYKLDQTQKKGTFKGFDMENKLRAEGSFSKFDFLNKNKQILQGNYTNYIYEEGVKIVEKYKNNILVDGVKVYELNTNRIQKIIPIIDGIPSNDEREISVYSYENNGEYFVENSKSENGKIGGKIAYYDKTDKLNFELFLNNEDPKKVKDCGENLFRYYPSDISDIEYKGSVSFEDDFSCGKSKNWVWLDFSSITSSNQLKVSSSQEKELRNHYLLNPTPYSLKNNDFDLSVDVLPENNKRCGAGFVIGDFENSYQICLNFTNNNGRKDGYLLIEKMNDHVFDKTYQKVIDVSDRLRFNQTHFRVRKVDNRIEIIIDNYTVFSADYSYLGEFISLVCYGDETKDYGAAFFDNFKLRIDMKNNTSNFVKMKKEGGVYTIPINLNDIINTNFIFDTGAADTLITPDIAMLLIKSGVITSEDWLPSQVYQFADGSTARSKRFKLKKLTIGNKTVRNVACSISNNLDAPLLLGQSVLKQFGKVTIDNENHRLLLE